MDRIILGLDVSTSCIGICVFHDDGTENGNILRMSQVVYKDKDFKEATTDFGKLYLKKQKFMQDLQNYVNYGITDIVIEEPLLSSNNEYTVATLLRFNGMIAEGCIDLFHIDPIFISSYDARKYAFPSFRSLKAEERPKPRPSPGAFVVKKGAKMRSSVPESMPLPVSEMSIWA